MQGNQICLILLHHIVRACVGPQSGLLQVIPFEAATKGHRHFSAATKEMPVLFWQLPQKLLFGSKPESGTAQTRTT